MTDAPDTPTTPVEAPAQDTDWKAEAEKLKAEARKWESRSKENAKAAQRLTELEESQKTELQRALDRAELAEKRASQFEQERQIAAWRSEVAAASGVPGDLLRGSSKEDLEAHAEQLKPLLNPRGPYVANPGGTPSNTASDERSFVRDLFGGH